MAIPALDIPPFFGARLDDCLRAHGMTGADLAVKLECSQQTIHALRNGTGRPSKSLAKLMALILGPHAGGYMIGERPDPPPIVPREQLQAAEKENPAGAR